MRAVLEAWDPTRHVDHMRNEVAAPSPPRVVLVVTQGRFRLELHSRAQWRAAIAWLQEPSRSTRRTVEGDHWETQPWYCRLPAGMTRAGPRAAMLKALRAAEDLATQLD